MRKKYLVNYNQQKNNKEIYYILMLKLEKPLTDKIVTHCISSDLSGRD